MKQSAALGAAPNPQDLKTHINFNTQYNIIYIYIVIYAQFCATSSIQEFVQCLIRRTCDMFMNKPPRSFLHLPIVTQLVICQFNKSHGRQTQKSVLFFNSCRCGLLAQNAC